MNRPGPAAAPAAVPSGETARRCLRSCLSAGCANFPPSGAMASRPWLTPVRGAGRQTARSSVHFSNACSRDESPDHGESDDCPTGMEHDHRSRAPERAGAARPGHVLGQAAGHGRHGLQLGTKVEPLAAGLWAGLLRDRDDLHGVEPVRHRPLRRRGLSRLAAPGRPDDRLGHRHQDDDAHDRPALRPDARAQVCDVDGGLRHAAAARSRKDTTSSPASTSTCRSTFISRAARPRRRRS